MMKFPHLTRRGARASLARAPRIALLLPLACGLAAARPSLSPEYTLPVSPREDSRQQDPETGADLLFLTKATSRDTHFYFHQRAWLADGSLIFFYSARARGGLMAYVVRTGELVQITAADGAKVGWATAAVNRNSVWCLTGERVLEIQLTVTIAQGGEQPHARVTARERFLCAVPGMNGFLHESCDGRRLAVGQIRGGGKPGIVLIDTRSGKWERLCDIPDGVAWHGHLQWSMTNPHWLSFAGAPQRLWVVDTRQRRPWCPYPAWPDELVTHESWWVNDQLLFCGGVHPKPTEDSHVKVLDLRAGTVRVIGAGSWWPGATPAELARRNWWHASGSPDGRWIAADNWHGDIMLFEGKTTRPRLLTARHRTYGGGEHPEVGWDRAGRQVVFGSHKLGGMTVCVATIPDAWQAELDGLRVGLEASPRRAP